MRHSRALRSLRFVNRAVALIPHPEKFHRGGEDAFISHERIISVADGVGGYADSGVNPAIFTRQVMQYSLEGCLEKPQGTSTPVEVLNYGLRETLKKRTVGGCPVTMALMLSDSRVSILNLGDCATYFLRTKGDRLTPLYRTTEQQHYFNCPYQLPDDRPERGQSAVVSAVAGDILFQCSDGVSDNVYPDDIIKELSLIVTGGHSTQSAAIAISELARRNATDSTYLSPFASHVRSQLGKDGYRGGKLDDITVLVAQVGTGDAPNSKVCPTLISEVEGIPGVK